MLDNLKALIVNTEAKVGLVMLLNSPASSARHGQWVVE